MPRPQKTGAEWFSHDANARNSKEIKAIRNKYGLEGVAVYWMVIETLTGLKDNRLLWDDLERELVAGDLGVESDYLFNFLTYCITLRLFVLAEFGPDHYLISPDLNERLRPLYEKRKKDRDRRKSGSYRGDNPGYRGDNPNNRGDNATKESKGKDSIGEESKEEEKIEREGERDIKEEIDILAVEQNKILDFLLKNNSARLEKWQLEANKAGVDLGDLQRAYANKAINEGFNGRRTSALAGFDRYLLTTITRKQNERKEQKNGTSNRATQTSTSGVRGPGGVQNDTSKPKSGYTF